MLSRSATTATSTRPSVPAPAGSGTHRSSLHRPSGFSSQPVCRSSSSGVTSSCSRIIHLLVAVSWRRRKLRLCRDGRQSRRLRVHASSPCYVPRRLRRGGTRMVLGSALDIFSREGFSYLSRWSHVFVGITWIGLLYFFNFVQVPAYAEMEASARNNAIDKLTSRALWWFRWAAAATLVSGILLIIFQEQYESDYMKSPGGVAIYAGVLLAVTMFLNVWLVIWPNQKKVIANARNVQAGGEADPAVPPAARRAALASRQNTIFSLPMLVFMVGPSHFPYASAIGTSGSQPATVW